MVSCEAREVLLQTSLSASLGTEKIAMHQVEAALRESGIDTAQLEDIKTMTAEACLNAIEHGCGFDANLRYHLELIREGRELILRVQDGGAHTGTDLDQSRSDADPTGIGVTGSGGGEMTESVGGQMTESVWGRMTEGAGGRTTESASHPIDGASCERPTETTSHADDAHARQRIDEVMSDNRDPRGWGLIMIDALADSWTLQGVGDMTVLEIRVRGPRCRGGNTVG